MINHPAISHARWSNKSLSSTFMSNSQVPPLIRDWNGSQKNLHHWRFSTCFDYVWVIYMLEPLRNTSKIEQLQANSPLLMAIAAIALTSWVNIGHIHTRYRGTPSYHPFIDGIFPHEPSSYWGISTYGNPRGTFRTDLEHHGPSGGSSLHAFCRWIPGPETTILWLYQMAK